MYSGVPNIFFCVGILAFFESKTLLYCSLNVIRVCFVLCVGKGRLKKGQKGFSGAKNGRSSQKRELRNKEEILKQRNKKQRIFERQTKGRERNHKRKQGKKAGR